MVGRVRRAHGIRGELVVESMTDAPDAVFASGRRVFAGTKGGALSKDGLELHVIRSSPFKGGLMMPSPDVVASGFVVQPDGTLQLSTLWPAAVPAGLSIVMQWWIPDPSGPQGFTASNALVAVTG